MGNITIRSKIVKEWAAIVGDSLAAVSQPVFLKNMTLFVYVYQGIWVDSFLFQQKEILKAISKVVGPNVVDRLYFQIKEQSKETPRKKERKVVQSRMVLLPDHEIRELEDRLPEIQDGELKQIVWRVFLKERARSYRNFSEKMNR